MGMSSSQARLLSLTSRQHDIEYKAQKLEAQKLQMANESRHVYQKYEDALNATKIQGASLGADGSIKFIDADLLVLENTGAEKLAKTIYLKNTDNGKIYISKAKANKYALPDTGIPGTEIEFMNRAGFLTNILKFDTVSNAAPTSTYSPVKTVKGAVTTREVPNLNPDWGYQAVASTAAPAGAISVSSVAGNFDPTKTYVINNKADLIALQTLTNSGKSTQGVRFVLNADIDMSGVTWTGIGNTDANAFKGIFDGNGHTISNLKGSSGLFTYVKGDATSVNNPSSGATVSATYGMISNLVLQNVDITKTGHEAGALICKNMGGYVDNCYASGNINGANWVGGLIGHNISGAVTQSTSNVNINATGNCVGGFIGHDTNGIMDHCISSGDVYASNGYVGGFIGHETSNGSSFIYECATQSKVTSPKSNKGAFLGQIDGGSSSTVIGSQYSAASGLNPVGNAAGTITSNGTDSSLTEGTNRTVTTTNITMPSKASVKSNIMMALDKSQTAVGADFEAKLDTWLMQFFKEDTRYSGGVLVNDALKMASINDFISDYLASGANSAAINALVTDVNNNTTTATAAYQDKYVPTRDYEYSPYASTAAASATKTTTINIGSVENIANNLYTAIKNAGHTDFADTEDVVKVKNWVQSKFNSSTDAGKLELAELNNLITANPDAVELEKLYNAINNNASYTVPAAKKVYTDPKAAYVVNSNPQAQAYETGWDMSNPDVVEALEYYKVIKDGYIIVEDEQASSNEWLVNLVNMGIAIFTEYDKASKQIFDTNIATNVMLQEVSDPIELKKAEAEYEASMRKIDDKDKKYDVELASLEAERNAIKNEVDTLKTVIKDNVDRTFKLFG